MPLQALRAAHRVSVMPVRKSISDRAVASMASRLRYALRMRRRASTATTSKGNKQHTTAGQYGGLGLWALLAKGLWRRPGGSPWFDFISSTSSSPWMAELVALTAALIAVLSARMAAYLQAAVKLAVRRDKINAQSAPVTAGTGLGISSNFGSASVLL